MVSLAILAIGILLLVAVYMAQGSGRTARAAQEIRVGDDSATVLAGLGVPTARCDARDLAHLRDALPEGTPRISADETLDRLRRGTTLRWVWGERPGCGARPGNTEVGFSRDGRVLWTVPEHGAEPALLP